MAGKDDNMIRIIPIDPEKDLNQLLEVIRTSFLTVAEMFGLSEDNAPTNPAFLTLERLEAAIRNDVTFLAAKEEEKIVGCVGIEPGKDAGIFYLERLAVLPQHRHQKIGARLLESAFDEIKNRGARKISIGIIDENTVLKQWYEQFGFAIQSIKQFSNLPFTVCFLEKRLD